MYFLANPPIFEARPFTGDEGSVVDIQGWMLANGVESTHIPAVGEEGEEGYIPDRITFPTDGSSPQNVDGEVKAGEWLMLNGAFVPMPANELFTQYTQTQ